MSILEAAGATAICFFTVRYVIHPLLGAISDADKRRRRKEGEKR